MKIDTPKSTSGVRSTKNLKISRPTTNPFADALDDSQIDQIAPKTPPTHILNASDILSIQEKVQSSPHERGEKMLEALDRLHADIVLGQLNIQNLQEMASILHGKMHGFSDAKLQSILNQIEQRVAIELAKRGRY